jgi:ankyrin repeat protein
VRRAAIAQPSGMRSELPGDSTQVQRSAAMSDVNVTAIGLNTPLHMAAFGGSTEMVLLEAGANTAARDDVGMTPLGASKEGHSDVVHVLVRRGRRQ